MLFNSEIGKFLGYCGLRKVDEIGVIEIMYFFDLEYWRNGYVLEVVEVFIKYVIEILNVIRIIVRVKVVNESLKKFLWKFGFIYIYEVNYSGCLLLYFEFYILFEEF